jgi:hypothetical protein
MKHLANLQQFGEEHGVPVYMASKGSLPNDVLDPRVFATLPAWTKLKAWEYVPVQYGPCVCDSDVLISPGDETCPDCSNTGIIPVEWEKRLRKVADGRIKRQCTHKYKIEVINAQVRVSLGADAWEQECRYCIGTGIRVAPWDPEAGEGPCSICRGTATRRRVGPPPRGTLSEQWIGFSTDEFERVTDSGFPGYQRPRFPLLELDWTVDRCEAFLAERGWHAEKSACKGCPFHSDDIWIEMKHRDPDEFAEVVAYDATFRTAPGLDAERFLHESRLPLDIAVERAEQQLNTRGTQTLLFGEKRRRQPRGCSPYGCRSMGADDAA